MTKAEEIYHRFVQYEWNEIGEGMKKSILDAINEALRQPPGMLCTFCEKEIIETELTYTEDAEPSHIKCLEDFNKHWEDRAEMMDLMGY
jgi:hypothetical protein